MSDTAGAAQQRRRFRWRETVRDMRLGVSDDGRIALQMPSVLPPIMTGQAVAMDAAEAGTLGGSLLVESARASSRNLGDVINEAAGGDLAGEAVAAFTAFLEQQGYAGYMSQELSASMAYLFMAGYLRGRVANASDS